MSYLPKKMVENDIKKHVRKDKNGVERVSFEAYFGTDPVTKQAIRITRSDDELKRDIRIFYQHHQAGVDVAVCLPAMESIDAREALDLLSKLKINLTLREVVSRYAEGNCPKGRHRRGQRYQPAHCLKGPCRS